MTAKQNKLEKIDQSTTFFGVHEAPSDKQISMKKFAAMLSYHYYDPRDGFGYFYVTSEQILLNKKVILMDKVRNVEHVLMLTKLWTMKTIERENIHEFHGFRATCKSFLHEIWVCCTCL